MEKNQMEKKERVYMSTQLLCMLPPVACKVFGYILGWQNSDIIKYYPRRFSKLLHLTEEEVELAVQTLVDNKLLEIGCIDGTFTFVINTSLVKKYYGVELQKVHDHEGFKMAEKATWNLEGVQEREPSAGSNIEDMDEAQLRRLLLRIEASLQEKEQVARLVRAASEPSQGAEDDLPF